MLLENYKKWVIIKSRLLIQIITCSQLRVHYVGWNSRHDEVNPLSLAWVREWQSEELLSDAAGSCTEDTLLNANTVAGGSTVSNVQNNAGLAPVGAGVCKLQNGNGCAYVCIIINQISNRQILVYVCNWSTPGSTKEKRASRCVFLHARSSMGMCLSPLLSNRQLYLIVYVCICKLTLLNNCIYIKQLFYC